jgi:PAS domain S-box-containing protein
VLSEMAHRQLEERFTKAFHTSPDSININRVKDGLYIDVNQGFTALTGYTPPEVIGKTSYEINIWDNPGDRERLVQGLRAHGEVWNLEARFRLKDGTVKVGLMSAKFIDVDGETCILSVTRDISERKQAEELLQRTTNELRAAYDATLQGWSSALELRERETAGHSQRVVSYTIRLAKTFGISAGQLDHIQRGALLHDIGKMGVPDSILLKPGPLSEDEWVIMRQHPIYAQRMLSKIPYLLPAVDIPYCHHEQWDGSGYPRGLTGPEIPLAARLFAVVDVWDALLSDRPYRPAWTEKAALQYLKDQSGRQFDPSVVQAFFRLLESDWVAAGKSDLFGPFDNPG